MANLLASSEGGELLAAILLVVDLAGHVLQVLHTSQWSWSRSDSAASEETKEGTINCILLLEHHQTLLLCVLCCTWRWCASTRLRSVRKSQWSLFSMLTVPQG